jgi:hypothetical protein
MDDLTVGDWECGTALLLLIGSAACCIAALLLVVSRVGAAADPLCTYFDALATMPGVHVAEWVGYPEGWKDYPQEWDYETFLPVLSGGILQRVSGSQQWLWGYRSLETWTDQAGEHDGHHDFCDAVLVIDQ